MDPTEQIIETHTLEDNQCRTINFPPGKDSWFSPERVDYISRFIEMMFFLFGIPWLLTNLFKRPLETMKIVGAAQAGA